MKSIFRNCFQWLVMFAGLASLHSEDNVQFVVDGISTNFHGPLTIGVSGTNNSLLVLNGGTVTNTVGVIGDEASAAGNFAVVTGGGSTWHNQERLLVGDDGFRNWLMITNRGSVVASNVYIGPPQSRFGSGASNTAIVSDNGSRWIVARTFSLGVDSHGCRLIVTNGGYLESNISRIGMRDGGRNNSASVTGLGSIWKTHSDLTLGEYGKSNHLFVTEGGRVEAARLQSSIGTGAKDNSIFISGTNSSVHLSDQFVMRGESNRLHLISGALLNTPITTIAGLNNEVLVREPGSIVRSSRIELWASAATTIADGGMFIATNALSNGFLQIASAPFAIEKGIVQVDHLILTNQQTRAFIPMSFNSGNLLVRQLTLPSSRSYPDAYRLTIGNGIDPAEFTLNGLGMPPSRSSLLISTNATMHGSGTNIGRVSNNGTLSVRTHLVIDGDLLNAGTLKFQIPQEVSGIGASNPPPATALLIVTNRLVLGGSLAVTLTNNFRPLGTNLFTIMRWGTRTGEFSNAPNGSRLNAGQGSFRVTYTDRELILSDYREDLDGDGIDDLWAINYFGHSPLTTAEKLADTDADGLSNASEEVAGTDPKDPLSVFQIQSIERQETPQTILRFTYTPGKRYRLWTATDLNSWTEISPLRLQFPLPGVAEWIDDSAKDSPLGFYRVTVE